MTAPQAIAATTLDRAEPRAVRRDAYSYAVIPNALPADIYADLCAAYPTLDDVDSDLRQISNRRIDLLSSWGQTLLSSDRIPPVWRDFMDNHTSPAFVRQVFDLFPEAVENPEAAEPVVRMDLFGEGLSDRLNLPEVVYRDAIVPRVTMGVNTPVAVASSVRGAHLDSERKAFFGLFYLRHPDDDSTGGDLALYRWKDGADRTLVEHKAHPDAIELIEVVPYEPNTMVLVLNTRDSLHGVTPRDPTPHMRRLVITSGWFPGIDKDSVG